MYKYNQFILEKEFNHWEFLYDSTNEGFDTLMDKINSFLDKEYEVNTEKFEETVLNLFNRFKNKIGIASLIAGLLVGTYLTGSKVKELIQKSNIEPIKQEEVIKKVEEKEHKKVSLFTKKKNDLTKFLKALAQKESSLDPTTINKYGYIGKYQFGEMALKDVGLEDKINTTKFRKNPSIWPEKEQDRAMVKLLKKNKDYLGEYLSQFDGKIINGVKITKSGLLAGSHLVGASAVKQFLDSNGQFVPKDGNGVPVTDYIEKFGGYYLTFLNN
jgi:hypothetical protein